MRKSENSEAIVFAVAILLAFSFMLWVEAGAISPNVESAGEVSIGTGVLIEPGSGCGALLLNSDETYENGYGWSYGGTISPDYGSFAERYEGRVMVCAGVFDLTQATDYPGRTMDVYVWSGSDEPGAVIAMLPGVDPDPIAFWPDVSRHLVPFAVPCHESEIWWLGYWGTWTGSPLAWFIGADLNGPGGGRPMTKIAPGIGFPTGWQDVAIVWGTTAALGIGAEVVDCTVPTEVTTWGRIKRLNFEERQP